MDHELNKLQELINDGKIKESLKRIDELLEHSEENRATLLYLKGNAFRKEANWQQALNNYQLAIELDEQSPAVEARKMLIEILEFYNKDMFNQ